MSICESDFFCYVPIIPDSAGHLRRFVDTPSPLLCTNQPEKWKMAFVEVYIPAAYLTTTSSSLQIDVDNISTTVDLILPNSFTDFIFEASKEISVRKLGQYITISEGSADGQVSITLAKNVKVNLAARLAMVCGYPNEILDASVNQSKAGYDAQRPFHSIGIYYSLCQPLQGSSDKISMIVHPDSTGRVLFQCSPFIFRKVRVAAFANAYIEVTDALGDLVVFHEPSDRSYILLNFQYEA